MTKAGDFLSAILDNRTFGKAKEYSRLFSSWEQLTIKHGAAAAAFHARIQDVQRGIIMVEADHPGWIQLLQTKEYALLADLQKTFPELNISGIAFKLSKTPRIHNEPPSFAPSETDNAQNGTPQNNGESGGAEPETVNAAIETASGLDRIKDETLKEKLRSLEESVKSKNAAKKN